MRERVLQKSFGAGAAVVAVLVLLPVLGAALTIYLLAPHPIGYVTATVIIVVPMLFFLSPLRRSARFPGVIDFQEDAVNAERVKYSLSDFGPNGLEVIEFLARLPLLSIEHWQYMTSLPSIRRRSIAQQVVGLFDSEANPLDLPAGVPLRFSADQQAAEKISEITRTSQIENVADASSILSRAATGLVHRDVTRPSVFIELYYPFTDLIPIELLSRRKPGGGA